MPIVDGDLKFYNSNVDGSINLSSQYLSGSDVLFPPVLDIDADVEKKLWIKNTNGSSSFLQSKIYTVNGFTITNTNNTPISVAGCSTKVNLPAGLYSLTFPTSNSVVVVPPSGIARSAQTAVANGSTLNTVYLADSLPIQLVFNNSLSTADTATVKISDTSAYLYLALDSSGTPGTYAIRNGYTAGIDLGTIAAGQAKALWVKQSNPDGISNAGNPRKFSIILAGRGN